MEETLNDQYPEILADLAAKVADLLSAQGMERERAEAIGGLVANEVRRDWGGGYIYIPRGQSQRLSVRDREILQQYDGTNRDALCRRYGVSSRQFYRILRFRVNRRLKKD